MSNILKYSDFNLDNLTFKTMTNNKKKTMQQILLPSYNGMRCPLLQLPKILLDMYGVPSKCDYYKEDYQRYFLKLPLDKEQEDIKQLIKFFESIDDLLSSDKFKEQYIQSTNAKYQSIVRTSLNKDGEPIENKHSYIKLKLLAEYPSNEILTSIIEQTEKNTKRVQMDIKTITQFEKYFFLRSILTCMIVPVKIWIHQTSSEVSYGLTFKLIKVMVKQPIEKTLKQKTDDHSIDFLNSDSD